MKHKHTMNGHCQCTCQHDTNTRAMHQQGERMIDEVIQPELNFDKNETVYITSCHNTQIEKLQVMNPQAKYIVHCMLGEEEVYLQMFKISDFQTKSSFSSNQNKRLTLSTTRLFKKYGGVHKFDLCNIRYDQVHLTQEQKQSVHKWMLYNGSLQGTI